MYGLSGKDLSNIIRKSRSHASNILAGNRSLQEEDASRIDRKYNTGDRYQLFIHWARRGHDPQWFGQYLEYEAQALVINTFEALTVPGLLQTPEYARELVMALGDVDVDGAVDERMARKQIFDKPNSPLIWALITENVIDWPIGGREVMRQQLAYLLEVSELPNVGLRVVERSSGAHAGVDGSFSIISGDFGEIAYTESPGSGRLVPSNTEVRSYRARYDRIGQVASPERTSREIIHRAMEAL